jgi:hypothetical protein
MIMFTIKITILGYPFKTNPNEGFVLGGVLAKHSVSSAKLLLKSLPLLTMWVHPLAQNIPGHHQSMGGDERL